MLPSGKLGGFAEAPPQPLLPGLFVEEDAMVKVKTQLITDPKEALQRRTTASESVRQRLLAGLPVAQRRLELNGISTAVLEGGDGPPVVLLHGPGEYAAKWLRVIPDLVKTRRVIAPDLPGHGASEVIGGEVDAARVMGWLDDLVECTCPSPPALVGQILGGAIAARFASDHSERLSNLVLVDALGLAALQPAPEFGRALHEFLSQPAEATHDRLWNLCAFDLEALRNRLGERWDWIKAYNLDRARTPALQVSQRALMEQFGMPAIPQAHLARIIVPTSLIWGRHDLATSLSVAQAASSRFGWPLYVIEQAADDPPLEQPEAFLKALRTALDSSARGSLGITAPQERSRTAWDRIAPRYDTATTPTHLWLAEQGLRRAGLRKGMEFLDVAAGSGALSIPAARLGAKVLAVDQSPVMLELLKARARREGLTMETRVMDAHVLELPDGSFDMVGSQFGVMLFPDMPKGLREMARVTKPDGCVLVHAYGDPHRIEFLSFLTRAVQAVRPDFHGPPADPPLLEFQLADPERLRQELSETGLKSVSVETITETLEFETGRRLWDWLVSSNPIVETVLGSLKLRSDERGMIKQRLETMVRDRAGRDSTARLTNPINIGVGRK
jgi:pimeloyl-ACP methyl ester carboxylesterase/ubiquinone/menaquinone biosynthesis C-methylase UbiE